MSKISELGQGILRVKTRVHTLMQPRKNIGKSVKMIACVDGTVFEREFKSGGACEIYHIQYCTMPSKKIIEANRRQYALCLQALPLDGVK